MKFLPGLVRVLLTGATAFMLGTAHADVTLLNVSYDVTRELYKDINPAFIEHWAKTTGEKVAVEQSHGGSSKQALAVANGLEADVVTMNQDTDIELLARSGLVPADWRQRLPYNSAPYTSTTVFLVRKGNPKSIRDWDDLAKPGIAAIVPNPKTSGNGRYTYLAAWGYAIKKFGDETRARDFVIRLFRNVPVLDIGAPEEVYEQPASPFVYGFLGAVNLFHGRVQDHHLHVGEGRLPLGHNGFQAGAEALGFVRPHELDIEINLAETAGIAARIERVLVFGPTARVELSGAERESSRFYEVELSPERVAALNLANGQWVRLKPARIRLFASELQPAGSTSLPAGSQIGLDGEGI